MFAANCNKDCACLKQLADGKAVFVQGLGVGTNVAVAIGDIAGLYEWIHAAVETGLVAWTM